MNTKTLSTKSLTTIDQYKGFTIGKAACSIPYFNNKTTRVRAALRVYGGKGSPKDIYEEVMACFTKEHVDTAVLTGESLKKYIADKNIGIDCSGLVYYILDAESKELGRGQLDKHIHFIACQGLVAKLRCALRPVENCDVATFASDANSHVVAMKDVQPGDIITMVGGATSGATNNERDHILVIHQIEYQNFVPIKIHYTHAIAYPEDGVYGTGVRQGVIDIMDQRENILSANWTEGISPVNRLVARAKDSKTELRRLNWF